MVAWEDTRICTQSVYNGAKQLACSSKGGAPLCNGMAAMAKKDKQAILDCLVQG